MKRKLRIAMVLASPFPANHGTPGSIKEMAAALAKEGHELHIVTYPFGEGEDPPGLRVHRTMDLGFSKKVVVGGYHELTVWDVAAGNSIFNECNPSSRLILSLAPT